MSSYSGNDLSGSVPLPAREKVKDAKHRVLCGVLTCPETLATRDGWSVEITAGYELGKGRVLIKTRRSGARQGGHKEAVKERVKPHYDEILYRAHEDSKGNPYANGKKHAPSYIPMKDGSIITAATEKDFALAVNAANARKWYRQLERSRAPHAGHYLEHDDLPITIRCARCGRLSKIEVAEQRQ
jgi:hypothetical protein